MSMQQIGFDNDKYLKMQSEHIQHRIAQFDNKLYLELGGKLFETITPRVCCLDSSRTARLICSLSSKSRLKS